MCYTSSRHYASWSSIPKGTDGVFGPGCESAVSRYQTKKGIICHRNCRCNSWEKLRADITPIQIALKNKGYYIPACDGIATEDTYKAVKNISPTME